MENYHRSNFTKYIFKRRWIFFSFFSNACGNFKIVTCLFHGEKIDRFFFLSRKNLSIFFEKWISTKLIIIYQKPFRFARFRASNKFNILNYIVLFEIYIYRMLILIILRNKNVSTLIICKIHFIYSIILFIFFCVYVIQEIQSGKSIKIPSLLLYYPFHEKMKANLCFSSAGYLAKNSIFLLLFQDKWTKYNLIRRWIAKISILYEIENYKFVVSLKVCSV